MSEQLTATQRVLSGAAVALALAGCSEKQTNAEPVVPDATPTESAPAQAGDQIGYDVSFPQCDTKLSEDQPFGIVGLNGTLANNFNDCFEEQITWAKDSTGDTSQPAAATYVHIGNPGSKLASKWPQEGSNRYGTCEGDDSLACDYEYGAMLAEQDIKVAAQQDADKLPVWLDVEPNYSWFFNDKPRNVAAMEGMTQAFEANGMPVGIYSSADIWQQVAGDIPADSELRGLPNWVLGAGDLEDARANCKTAGFTGEVVLAQIADNVQIDKDLIC
ncbi:MAG: hypothetical protein JWN82_390 [Candidatus Saccharibacteria bacterium]|nr:hypothetical protein [Candidatus Saccharibacteria bacterium]